MKWFRYPLCLFFLLPAALTIKAQVKPALPLKKVPVNIINYEQGLSDNESSAIVTDTLGFTWISTGNGLQRYNGYILEDIDPVIEKDTIKIRSRVVFCKLLNGDLWISCNKGVIAYNPFTNVFKNIIPVSCLANEVFTILPLNETAEGVWCVQKGLGMVIYDENGNLKKKVPTVDPHILNAIINSDYLRSRSVVAVNHTHIFMWLNSRRMLDYNTATHYADVITEQTDEIAGISCNSAYFYIITHNSLQKYRIADHQLLITLPLKNIVDQPIGSSGVYAIGEKRIIATANDQVIELDANLGNPRLLTTFNGQPLLVAGTTQHVYRDAYERIWLLTNDNIIRIQDKEIPFSYLKYPYAGNNFVRSLYFDEQTHQLLAGCINGGLQVYDSASNPLWHDLLKTNDVKDVLGITKLTPDNYLVITWTRGWYLFELKTRKLSPINYQGEKKWKHLLYDNAFSSNIQRLNDSTLIAASISNVFKCIFRGNSLVSVKPLLPFFKTIDDRITTCYYASDGTLWTTAYPGVVYMTGKNGSVQTHAAEKSAGRCFTEDADHHIWIGTSNGLYVCDMKGTLLRTFHKKSGLLNDCIYSLLPLRGRPAVLAATNMGLSTIDLNGNITNYTKELGLQDNEFNTASATISAEGKYFLGGVSGITAFYPATLNELQSKQILNMTKLVVNDSSYNFSGIWKGDTIKLKYNQNHLQFDFATTGPLNADKYFYRYRLVGFGDNWQSTHRPTGIRYILQPGTYTLEVTSSNELAGAEVKKNILIVIDPPFWLRWWFFVIIAICAVGAIAIIVTFYNKRKYQKTLQELLLKQSLQTQRERISRDLHDNLGAQANAIFYGTELLRQNHNDGQKLVDNLHDTAGDMLTVLRETLWAMKITQVEAADLWLRILNFARKIGSYYLDIKIDITGNPPAELILNATMALNMILIVQEAINNAIRHSGASIITISSFENKNIWRIEIIDNGSGFDLVTLSKKTESYGLENMAERASESKILFGINSLPVHGTKISLELDLQKLETLVIN